MSSDYLRYERKEGESFIAECGSCAQALRAVTQKGKPYLGAYIDNPTIRALQQDLEDLSLQLSGRWYYYRGIAERYSIAAPTPALERRIGALVKAWRQETACLPESLTEMFDSSAKEEGQRWHMHYEPAVSLCTNPTTQIIINHAYPEYTNFQPSEKDEIISSPLGQAVLIGSRRCKRGMYTHAFSLMHRAMPTKRLTIATTS